MDDKTSCRRLTALILIDCVRDPCSCQFYILTSLPSILFLSSWLYVFTLNIELIYSLESNYGEIFNLRHDYILYYNNFVISFKLSKMGGQFFLMIIARHCATK